MVMARRVLPTILAFVMVASGSPLALSSAPNPAMASIEDLMSITVTTVTFDPRRVTGKVTWR